MDVVLHIGAPKTGSSAFQIFLQRHREAFLDAGIWVPPKSLHAHRIAAQAITDSRRLRRSDVRDICGLPIEAALTPLEEACADGTWGAALLSSEYMLNAEVPVLLDLLRGAGAQPTRVVVLIRRQDRLIESLYGQEVRAMGRTAPLGREAIAHRASLDWESLLDPWEAAMPEGSLRVLGYDPLARDGGVLAACCEACDLPPALLRLAKDDAPRSENVGLPADLLELARIANALSGVSLRPFLERAAASSDTWAPKFRLSGTRKKAILDAYRQSNSRIIDRHFGGDPSPLGLDEPIDESDPGVDFTGRLPAESLARVFAFAAKEEATESARLKVRLRALEGAGRG